MKFGREKCAMLKMKSWKRETTEGIELPNQEKIKTIGEKENCKYLGLLEADSKLKWKKARKNNPDKPK